MNRIEEVLGILQEECAEVVQAVSKCNRFGLDNRKPGKPLTNAEHLEVELGDLLAMVDILLEQGVLKQANLDTAIKNKKEKLKKWSNIYESN